MILKSMLSMSAVNVAKAVVSLVTSLTLAAFVPPGEYGLVAFSLPFVALLTLLTDFGMSSTLVRERTLSAEDGGAIVTFMFGVGLVLSLALFASAGQIEVWSKLAGLAPVLRSFAVIAALSVWGIAPRGMLERDLAYTYIGAVEIGSLFAGLVSFGLVAWLGGGVYALIAHHVVFNGLRLAILSVVALPGRVSPNLRFGRVGRLMRDGSVILGTNLMSFLGRNLANIVIGSHIGAQALGLYGLANQFMTVPLILLSWPVSGVLLALLSRIDDREQTAALVLSVIAFTALVTFPMMLFIAIGLRFPLTALYSDHWLGLLDLLIWLAPVGAVQAIAVYNGSVILAARRMRLQFWLGALNGLGLSLVFVATAGFGLPFLIRAYAISAIGVSVLMIYYTCKVGHIPASRLLLALAPGLLATAAAAAAGRLTGLDTAASWGQWCGLIAIFAVAFAAAAVLFRRHLLAAIRLLTGGVPGSSVSKAGSSA